MSRIRRLLLVILLGLIVIPGKMENTFSNPQLEEVLQAGEAIIWYLDHSGWAIQTKSRLLIFDYSERNIRPSEPSLDNGFINPAEIKDLKVMVFVSHSHGDHHDPFIYNWEKVIPDITYIFGWEQKKANPQYVYCGFKREKLTVDGVEIMTVVHDFDGIPESAFLVKVDDLVIFHSGDHGSGPPPFRPQFIDNLEYLTHAAPEIDLAFIPLFGEEFYAAEKLKANYTFPMHAGSSQYKDFAEQLNAADFPTKAVWAEHMGHKFVYKNGIVK